MDIGAFIVWLLCFVLGALMVWRPAAMLQRTLPAYPELVEDALALLIVRGVGVGFLLMSTRILFDS